MESTASIFSVIFCVVCAVSLYLGIYILSLNPNSSSNRLFFALSVALDIWSFGFAMAISAPDLSACLFWRRLSAIGWGPFFSIFLHFILDLTGKKELLSKWWTYLLLYVPSAVTLLGFTYFPSLNPGQYNMVYTNFGWVNSAVNNVWDWFHTGYYIFYSAIGIVTIWHWGRKSVNKSIRRQTRIISSSILVTIIAGSLTDIIANSVFLIEMPQIVPLLTIIPITAIYYTIRKYGFLNPKHTEEHEVLMNDQIRRRMINYLSNAFLAAGLLNIAAMYLFSEDADTGSSVLLSVFFVLCGFVIQVIQRSKISKALKDVFNALAMSALVPILTLRFIEFGGVTIWAFPFILLIITLIFGNRFIQITLSISILLTQVLVWVLKPQVELRIDAADYFIRIGMYCIAIWFAFFVKKVYMSKLYENGYQIGSQNIVMEISSDYVSVNESNFDDKTYNTLIRLGGFLNVSRFYLYLFDADKEELSCTHIWTDGQASVEGFDTMAAAKFPWLMSRIKVNEIIRIAESEISLPTEAAAEEITRLTFKQPGFLMLLPIVNKGEPLGFLGLDNVSEWKRWSETQLNMLKIVTNILADAISKVNQEREINYRACYDYLTKLPNRFLFKDRVRQSINLANRTNKLLAVIFIDLDSFKNVNDTMGHNGGDELLTEISQELLRNVRKSDAVSRFGGDEFLIMLNNIESVDNITRITDKIMGIFQKPFCLSGQEFFVTASAGIAVYPYDGDDADKLIKNADIAMYKAKDKGKNQYLLCSSEMKDEILLKMKLTNNLYRALERNEFILHYQPQVSIETKKITGVEALIRWQHPEMGMISPGLFIPLAEQTGLINPIGEWVLKTACTQCKAWQDAGLPPIRMAVNVSVHQFRNPNLVGIVRDVLAETGLNPQYLELEITESAAMCEAEYIIYVLNGLKELGITISIDDFGTQYSSLSRLNTMPIDRLKMDVQFIRDINRSDRDKAIAKGIISLAHNLGMYVIAEGVETKVQYDFLCSNACDEVQGYYFYRPVTAGEIEKALASTQHEKIDKNQSP